MGIFNILNKGINNIKDSLSPENSPLSDNKKVEEHYSKEVEEDIRVILEREKTKRHEITITAIMTIALVLFAFLMMCVVAATK